MTALTSQTLTELLASDTLGMVELVRTAPEKGRRCLAAGRQQPYTPPRTVRQLLICGMGGSGSTGDLLQAICAEADMPISVNKSPQLPAWVGSETLVVAVSYSGNTYETLGALRQAHSRGAMLLGLGSGGTLAEMASAEGFPLLRIAGGLPPRAALFEMLFTLLGSLEGYAPLRLQPAEIDAALADLDRAAADWALSAGVEPQPLALARSLLKARHLLFWGDFGQTDAIALRWKNQFSENSKTLASVSLLPELNHNEVVALCHPFAADGECAGHHSRDALLYFNLETEIPAANATVLELVRPYLESVQTLTPPAGSRVQRLLQLVYLGDVCSVYLALLKGIDPTPIAAIDELKRRMT